MTIFIPPPVDAADTIPSLRTLSTTAAAHGWAETARKNPIPIMNKMVAWPFDLVSANASGQAMSAGVLWYTMIPVPHNITVSGGILEVISNPGASTNCYLGVYTISGTTATLAVGSADQSAVWNTAGVKTPSLTPTAITGGDGVYILAAFLWGTASSAFTILSASANASRYNSGLTAATDILRFGRFSSGLTALPSTFALLSATTAGPHWVGLT